MSTQTFTTLTIDEIIERIATLTPEQRTRAKRKPGMSRVDMAFYWGHKVKNDRPRAKREWVPTSELASRADCGYGLHIYDVEELVNYARWCHKHGWQVTAKVFSHNGLAEIKSDYANDNLWAILLEEVFGVTQFAALVYRPAISDDQAFIQSMYNKMVDEGSPFAEILKNWVEVKASNS